MYIDNDATPAPHSTISEIIRQRIRTNGDRFWAGDNISDYMEEGYKELLIEELT